MNENEIDLTNLGAEVKTDALPSINASPNISEQANESSSSKVVLVSILSVIILFVVLTQTGLVQKWLTWIEENCPISWISKLAGRLANLGNLAHLKFRGFYLRDGVSADVRELYPVFRKEKFLVNINKNIAEKITDYDIVGHRLRFKTDEGNTYYVSEVNLRGLVCFDQYGDKNIFRRTSPSEEFTLAKAS